MTHRKLRWVAPGLLALSGVACGLAGAVAPPGTSQQASATPISNQAALPPATATVAIPPQCQNVALVTPPAATTIAVPTPNLSANPDLSSQDQLRVLQEIVDTITQEYVYLDFNGTDWPNEAAAVRSHVENGLTTPALYAELDALVTALGDEHSYFESPVEVAASEAAMAGIVDYTGIGALLLPLLDKRRVTVLAILPGSPAESAGINPHDSILAVDGLPVAEPGIVYRERVRGPECSAAVLTVVSPGGEPRPVTVVRVHVSAPLPIDARLVPTSDGSRIGYLFIPSFFDETIPDRVRAELDAFGPLDGLIIDNRVNGGGVSSVLLPILGYLTSGRLGEFVSRSGSRPMDIAAQPIHNSQTVPLIVLVGEDTVSYAEIFAGVLQDSGRAALVGETTPGNVETLHGYIFDDGSQLWMAQERFDPAASHADWEASGIVPDVIVDADWDTFTFETDPAVAAALDLFGHR